MKIDASDFKVFFLTWAENIAILIHVGWLWTADCEWSSEKTYLLKYNQRTLTFVTTDTPDIIVYLYIVFILF